MRSFLFLLMLFPASLTAQTGSSSAASPDAEQMSIYRSFLLTYTQGGPRVVLNISQDIVKFEPEDYDRKDCLAGFSDDALKTSRPGTFTAGAFPEHHMVDPKHHEGSDPGDAIRKGDSVDHAVREGFSRALFTFSDVVFDKDHLHAAFRYSFHCGALCGHGATIVFEKGKNGVWKQSKRNCGSWIS